MFDSDFITNPYRAYSHLRAATPLYWMDKFRNGAWLVTRYADVLAGLHDARLSSQRSHNLTAALPSEVQKRIRNVQPDLFQVDALSRSAGAQPYPQTSE